MSFPDSNLFLPFCKKIKGSRPHGTGNPVVPPKLRFYNRHFSACNEGLRLYSSQRGAPKWKMKGRHRCVLSAAFQPVFTGPPLCGNAARLFSAPYLNRIILPRFSVVKAIHPLCQNLRKAKEKSRWKCSRIPLFLAKSRHSVYNAERSIMADFGSDGYEI